MFVSLPERINRIQKLHWHCRKQNIVVFFLLLDVIWWIIVYIFIYFSCGGLMLSEILLSLFFK